MKKWLIAICSILVALGAGTALADLTYTQGVGTTIFDFICFTTKHCPAHVLIDSSGTEKGTSANPLITTATPTLGTNTTPLVTILTPALGTTDPCSSGPKTNLPISSAITNTLAVAGVSAKKIYACSMILATTGAMAISFVEGTGSQCATLNQTAVIGGLTPALTGLSISSLMMGSGHGTIASTAIAADGLCIYQSTTGSILAGNLTYIQQ